MESVVALRHRVMRQGVPIRQIARELGVSRNTVRRYLRDEVEPGQRRPAARPTPVRDLVETRALEILADSKRWTRGKQQLTAAQLHTILLGEGFATGYTTVKLIVREWNRRRAEVFVPLIYRPGEVAQVDFFEVFVRVQGELLRAYLFVLRLMYSGRDFAWLYERQDQVSFLDGHVRAFEHLGGIPERLVYDNLKAAVARVLTGSERELSERFAALVAHYAFEPCFARPRTGHDKGGVEARGGAIRLQEFVPIPEGESLDEISRQLMERLDARQERVRNAAGRTIAERFAEEDLMEIPTFAFRAVKTSVVTASSRSLVRLEGSSYSVPSDWARLDLVAHLAATEVEIVGPDGSAKHPRLRRGQSSIDYRHYRKELARKPQALRSVGEELVAALGAPFTIAWAELCRIHGPKEGARAFAQVLRFLEDHGDELTARRLQQALDRGEPILIALRPDDDPGRESDIEIPAAFVGIEVETAVVGDFDRLLEIAS